MIQPYLTATRFALLEQGRNRLALGLLVVFTPLWFFLFGITIPQDPVAFKLMSTNTYLQVNGHNLTELTSGFNALTLIVGFMFFASTRSGIAFDRRLTLCGYRQPVLLAAKLTALAATGAAVSLYTVVVLQFFWRVGSFPLVWLSYFLSALMYGALGLALGVLVTSELAGFFTIIMLSLLDTTLQAPVYNPLANKSFLVAFPTYGSMQVAVNGGFAGHFDGLDVLVSLAWFVGLAFVGLAIFWRRTRI